MLIPICTYTWGMPSNLSLFEFWGFVFGLFFGWFGPRALLSGWAVGIAGGSWLAFSDGVKPIHSFLIGGDKYTMYTGLIALVANIAVAVIVQLVAGGKRIAAK